MSMSSAVDIEGGRCGQSNVFGCSILYIFMFIFIFIQVSAYIREGVLYLQSRFYLLYVNQIPTQIMI